ncbi:MAG TPA: STAS/SEC14 domain-containing protein [Myxococcaceae bacterium]|nr:STAS/SEC14 domain-containing protein [Myxococcaceae bacterium]
MPLDSKFDASRRLTVTTASGSLSFRDFLEHREALKRDPGFDASFALLLDMREVTDLSLSAEEIRMLAGRSAFSSDVRRAFVVVDPTAFGLSRMYSTHWELEGHSGETRVFKTVEEATQWLTRETAPHL